MIDYNKYTDQELNSWEKEIFGERLDNSKTFKDYLISQGAWIINKKYKRGAVRDQVKYVELNDKWSCLQNLRYRREKAKEHEQKSFDQINMSEIPF